MAVNLIKPAPEPEAKEQPERQPLLTVPDFRPYVRGGGGTVRALGSGSATLARRIWDSPRLRGLLVRVDWVAAARNPACWFCGAAVALGGWRLVGPYAGPVAAGLAAGWVALALMHSRPEAAASAAAEEQQERATADGDYDPRAAFITHLRAAIGTRSGVHLRTLAKQPPLEGYTIANIRALCDRYGVPVEARVKVARKVTVGVRLADLPTLSPTAPQEQRAAGSSAA